MCASQGILPQPEADSNGPVISRDDQIRRYFDQHFRLTCDSLESMYSDEPEPIWHGIARRGDGVNLGADPKFGKSHFGLQLAISVNAGVPFLGFPTTAGPCLIIDNETRGNDMLRRCRRIAESLGLDWLTVKQGLDVALQRGRRRSIDQIYTVLSRAVPRGTYNLIVLDALYQMLPEGISENDNAQMAEVMSCISAIADETQAAVLTVLHTSKGSQANKKVTDIGAGAGSIARACDAHLILRRHEHGNAAIMESVIRSQPPMAPFCIRYDYPCWRLAPELNTNNSSKGTQCPTLDVFVDALPAEFTKKKAVLESCHQIFGISRNVANMMLEESVRQKLVEHIPHTGNHAEQLRRIKKGA